MARYVVAGGTGRVGSVVAEELAVRGATPTVIVRDAVRGAELAQRGMGVAVGSLDDRRFLAETFHGADGCFVLLPENVDPNDFHGARRRMADAIVASVEDAGVPHVVLLSAIAAVLPDGNGPASDLHYFEHRLRSTPPVVSTLRACYFQDNVESVVTPALQAGIYPNFLPTADAAFPMIATEDVARFAADALTTPPPQSEIVDLIGPTYSVGHVASRLGAALQKELRIVDIPPAEHVAALTAAGVPPQLAEAIAEMYAAFTAGRIRPQGDRTRMGTTPIDIVIGECLRRRAPGFA